ncbi:hypothetical protein PsYK624_100210 [Phanerochaete sordida]|uniref:Uncharacterized protein n=1 Tax=Phanerochaete sordida TaxID=48140 RepID=A0A9P3GFF0_9APHY|nr:hypothetical protein PsYK624_100210 [Phanerochaete sordida]
MAIHIPQEQRPQEATARQPQEAAATADSSRSEPASLPGLTAQGLQSLTLEDKQRILGLARARGLLLADRPAQPQ